MIYRLNANLYIKPAAPISELKAILSKLYPLLAPEEVLEVIDQDSYIVIEECHHDETPPIPCSIVFSQTFWKQKLWP